MKPRRYDPDLTEEARRAKAEAIRILAPFFPKTTVKLYCPKILVEEREARNERIFQALISGEKPRVISAREGVSARLVSTIKTKLLHR